MANYWSKSFRTNIKSNASQKDIYMTNIKSNVSQKDKIMTNMKSNASQKDKKLPYMADKLFISLIWTFSVIYYI